MATREGERAGQVVVVHVRVGDGGDLDAGPCCGVLDRAEVPGWIDDQCVPAVVGEVGVVAQLGDLQRADLHPSLQFK